MLMEPSMQTIRQCKKPNISGYVICRNGSYLLLFKKKQSQSFEILHK